MNEEKWAIAIRVTAELLGDPRFVPEDASLTVQRLTENVNLAGVLREVFSNDAVSLLAAANDFESGFRAIEDLYGYYDPTAREIQIYFSRIQADHARFLASETELLTIVRLHEHAHAIVHLGLCAGDIESALAKLNGSGRSDWRELLAARDAAFTALDTQTHELLAQAITWASIARRKDRDNLAEVFLELQTHQPSRYQFDPSIKRGALSADWPLILRASRRETDVYREEPFEILKGISALFTPRFMEDEDEPDSSFPAVNQFLSRAQEALAHVDLAKQPASPGPSNLARLLLARRSYIELRMYKETGHQRPHFHVEFKKEFDSSYALDTLELLAGFMPRRYEDVMLPIAREMRDELMNTWVTLNGPLRVVLPAPPSAA